MMQKLNPHKFLFKILHCIPSALWNVVSFVSHFKELSINSWSLFSSVQRKEPVCFCFGSGYFAFPHAWFLWFALSSWCHLFCMPGSTGHLTRSGYGCITLLLLHRLHSHLTSPSACVHPAAAELCGTIPGCRPDSYPMLGADFNPGWWQLWAPSAGACGSNQLSASVESSLGPWVSPPTSPSSVTTPRAWRSETGRLVSSEKVAVCLLGKLWDAGV